jgi:putative SOS response-associated peptidase YedK
MCGRYTDTKRNKALLAKVGHPADLPFTPRYNIAPTQEASIVPLSAEGAPGYKRVRWGLLPHWAKDESMRVSIINARCETVAEKAAFRHAYRHRRCLVLADGFYEWRKEAGGKQPVYIRMRKGRAFVFGGPCERSGAMASGSWRVFASSRHRRTSCVRLCMTGCP